MFERIMQSFRFSANNRPELPVDGELLALLKQMAAEEKKEVEEIVQDLLWTAVADRYKAVENFQPWDKLTPREKQAAALACLGYTNDEIAAVMGISANTVKTYMRRVLLKFDVSSKTQLQLALTGWDFAAWLEEQS